LDGSGGLGCGLDAFTRDAAVVSSTSDLATISSIATQVDELARRITQLAESYGTTPDSAIAGELYAVERALNAAMRSLDRVSRLLSGS
jgi:hypothetical protein